MFSTNHREKLSKTKSVKDCFCSKELINDSCLFFYKQLLNFLWNDKLSECLKVNNNLCKPKFSLKVIVISIKSIYLYLLYRIILSKWRMKQYLTLKRDWWTPRTDWPSW